MRKQKHNILFLQDTHLTTNSTHFFDSLWPGRCYHSCHTNRSRGVSILIRRNLPYELIEANRSDCGNFVMVVIKIGTQTYLMANIYGPNNDDPCFYHTVIDMMHSFQTDHIVIGGDFNFVVNPTVDSFNYAREYNVNAKHVFMSFANDEGIVDIWRVKNPNKLEYIWTKNNPLKCGRLDMFFVSTQLVQAVQDVIIKPGYRTDHCVVAMPLCTAETQKGPGLWKFNESV